uniref:Uncharacterized protein n=1 Tax=Anguilla anguilla TaxID=7936 RepID=A0A0E9PZN6_ANGAN
MKNNRIISEPVVSFMFTTCLSSTPNHCECNMQTLEGCESLQRKHYLVYKLLRGCALEYHLGHWCCSLEHDLT